MCNVPNAFVCIEVKFIIRIFSFTHFFKNTAIILNTALSILSVKKFIRSLLLNCEVYIV